MLNGEALDMIYGNSDLDMLNFQDKDFVCTAPFRHITLSLKRGGRKNENS